MAKKKKSVASKSKSGAEPSSDSGSGSGSDSPKFEESLSELETIVSKLESGTLSLSDSIRSYEKGVGLLKQCHAALTHVQRKVELLTRVDEHGRQSTAPLDGQGTATDQPGRARKGRPNEQSQASEQEGEVDESGRLF